MMAELTGTRAILRQKHQLFFTGVHDCLDKGTCKNLHPAFPLLSMEILFCRRLLPLCVCENIISVSMIARAQSFSDAVSEEGLGKQKKHKGLAPKMLDSFGCYVEVLQKNILMPFLHLQCRICSVDQCTGTLITYSGYLCTMSQYSAKSSFTTAFREFFSPGFHPILQLG